MEQMHFERTNALIAKRKQICNELSSYVSVLVGHDIDAKHVHSDKEGWSFYIPAKSLWENHPLIMCHYHGPIFIVIPYNDWEKLENEQVYVTEYVDNANWSYGYYWEGASLLNGVHWQPLENQPGIHDTKKIQRYLKILLCRTNLLVSGYKPDTEECVLCEVNHCPFSPCKSPLASWDNEVQEVDDRVRLYGIVSKNLMKRFKFKTVNCFSHQGNYILISPAYKKDTVMVYLPQSILIDLLYNPNSRDMLELFHSLEMKLGSRFDNYRISIPESATVDLFYQFWSLDYSSEWSSKSNKKGTVSTTPIKQHHETNNIAKVIANYIKKS